MDRRSVRIQRDTTYIRTYAQADRNVRAAQRLERSLRHAACMRQTYVHARTHIPGAQVPPRMKTQPE